MLNARIFVLISHVARLRPTMASDCWQFDLKRIEQPEWIDPAKGEPTLMLFSVVE
jgi:hypothetical protein